MGLRSSFLFIHLSSTPAFKIDNNQLPEVWVTAAVSGPRAGLQGTLRRYRSLWRTGG